MTLTEYPDLEQRSPEWYAARCGIVTASAVGKLLTPTLQVADNDVSRGLTALLVAERIVGEPEVNDYMSADMWRGVEEEPRAVEWYAEKHAPVTTIGFQVRDDWGFKIGYSPDALVGEEGLVEVKAPRPKTHLQTILSNDVPAQHMAQLQGGLLVSGRKWIDFLSWCSGMPPVVRRVYPDPQWHEAVVQAVQAFEVRARLMLATYQERTEGQPATEPADLEIVI